MTNRMHLRAKIDLHPISKACGPTIGNVHRIGERLVNQFERSLEKRERIISLSLFR